MEILFLLLGLAAGALVAYLLLHSHSASLTHSLTESGERRVEELKEQYGRQIAEMKLQASHQVSELKEQFSMQFSEQKQTYNQQISTLREQYDNQLSSQKEQHALQISSLKEQQEQQLRQQMELLKEQMTTASEKILAERAEQLSVVNRDQLSTILTPLQANIQQMREAVQRTGEQSHTTMERLDATIKQSIEKSREVGERADKLAQALTGENKTQGNFGELRLKHLLQDMGLEEGTQFEEQATMRDAKGNAIYEEEEGRRMIPDVILHFPDERDVIIDSKMSFTAFEDYHNAQDDSARQDALRRHVASVRSHVNELSRKNYSKYIQEGRGKLDFVLMYVFSESALQLALANDATLWKEAYDKGVVIAGSQNLYMMLRVLEMTWKQVRQVENQQKIMECANTIIDRIQLYAERLESARTQLQKTQDAFDKLDTLSRNEGSSIYTPAARLLKMGASENPKRKLKIAATEEFPMVESNDETGENDL